MYVPTAFRELDGAKLSDFIERHSFGVLVSQIEGAPFATHLPFLLEREAGPHGTLVGHMARANPQWELSRGQTVLAIFSGPHCYVSPAWYEADNVVPTWNYVAVHASGKLEIVEDAAGLAKIVRNTTDYYERSRPTPWKFDEDTKFAERLLTQIIGFRIQLDSIEGKWKLNQNQPAERQEKVANALQQAGSENAKAIANLMKERLNRSRPNDS